MICKLLIACLALVPVTIMADKFFLGGCGKFECFLDGNAGTQQGLNMVNEFFSTGPAELHLWDPSPTESPQTCNYMDVGALTAGSRTFSYKINKDSTTITGMIKYVQSPTPRFELTGNLPDAVLGANHKGQAYWYPFYISPTDLGVIACKNSGLGRRETIYVFTNQDYSKLDSTCAADAISTVINKKVMTIKSAANGSPACA